MKPFPAIRLMMALILGGCAAVGSTEAAVAGGRGSAQPFMPFGQAIGAPQGYSDMCVARAALCASFAPPKRVPSVILASHKVDASVPASDLAAVSAPLAEPAVASGATGAIAAFLPPALLAGSALGVSPYVASTSAALTGSQPLAAARYDYFRRAQAPAPIVVPGVVEAEEAEMALAERVRMLKDINRLVNSRVRQATDMQLFGIDELWRPTGLDRMAVGDCEDFAIEKRILLLERGYPAKDLFFAVAFRPDIGLHAVLVARTQAGDMVLDNRSARVSLWSKIDYVWIKRQSGDNPSAWALVDESRPAFTQIAMNSSSFGATLTVSP